MNCYLLSLDLRIIVSMRTVLAKIPRLARKNRIIVSDSASIRVSVYYNAYYIPYINVTGCLTVSSLLQGRFEIFRRMVLSHSKEKSSMKKKLFLKLKLNVDG